MTNEKHLEAIAKLLARIAAGRDADDDYVKSIMIWAYGCDPDEKIPRAAAKKTVSDADILEVYETYPSKDITNRGRVCRTSADKKKIKAIIGSGRETKDTLIAKIKQELNERSSSGSYLRNLSTLLNNLPDLENETLFKPAAISKYR